MSTLNEEITRLEEAKAAIDEILIAKGVSIPANATLDTYHTLINSIETGTSSEEVTATKANVLAGTTTITSDSNDEIVEGTMPNNGAVSQSLNAGVSYTIPKGYHDGNGKITANSLASQTDGTATDAQILKDQTAYVDGVKVTGTMPNNGAQNKTITPSSSTQTYTIPAGYHNGSGKVTVSGYGTKYTMGSKTASHDTLNSATAYLLASGVPTNASVIVTGTIKSTATAAATTYYIDGGLPGGEYGEVTIGAKTTDCTSTPNIGKAQMTSIRIYREGTNIYYYNSSGKLYSLSCTVNYFYSA